MVRFPREVRSRGTGFSDASRADTPARDGADAMMSLRITAAAAQAATAHYLASASHVAFALAFRPGEGLFHRLALIISHAHLGQDGLGVDLLGDLRRCRRRGDRKLL